MAGSATKSKIRLHHLATMQPVTVLTDEIVLGISPLPLDHGKLPPIWEVTLIADCPKSQTRTWTHYKGDSELPADENWLCILAVRGNSLF